MKKKMDDDDCFKKNLKFFSFIYLIFWKIVKCVYNSRILSC